MQSLPEIDRFNDNAHKIMGNGKMWAVSYSTVVAYKGPNCPGGIRRDRNYSKTTAKHMTLMGVKNWRQVDDATFEREAAL